MSPCQRYDDAPPNDVIQDWNQSHDTIGIRRHKNGSNSAKNTIYHNNLVYYTAMAGLFVTQGRSERMLRDGGIKINQLCFENGSHTPLDSDTYIFLDILKSKGNKRKEKEQPFALCYCPRVCFLCALKQLHKRRKHNWKPESPLFILDDGEVLQYSPLLKAVKMSVSAIGENKKAYGTHSFRSGGNSENWERGYSTSTRETLAHWKSSATRRVYEMKIKRNKKQMITLAKKELLNASVKQQMLKMCTNYCNKKSRRQLSRLERRKKRKHRLKRSNTL
eukprot:422717_1